MSENIVKLVTAAAGGDSDAAARFYAKTLKTSYYLAYALSNDDAKAVEISKNAYANSFASFDKLLIPEAYEIWLKQNIATAYKDVAEFSFADADGDAQPLSSEFLPEECFADLDKAKEVVKAVSELDTQRRAALVLHYFNGMPSASIAKYFAVSESTANSILAKARDEVLEKTGNEAVLITEGGELPVLTRIFLRESENLELDSDVVRGIFAYAIETYEASKPEPEPEAPVVINVPEEVGEPVIEEVVVQEDDGVQEEADVAFEELRRSVGLNEFEREVAPQDDESGDISSYSAPNMSENDKVEKGKPNIKAIIIIVAVLLALAAVIALVVKGGEDKPSNTTTTAQQSNLPAVKWVEDAMEGKSEITYLNEYYCSYKSAETGLYGLLDYQGNEMLKAEFDGFELCGPGRSYNGNSDYHILAIEDGEMYLVMTNPDTGAVAVAKSTHDADHESAPEWSAPEGVAYDEMDRPFEGYAAVRSGGKWGYITVNNGKLVIPYEYDAAIEREDYSSSDYCYGFDSGLVAVRKGDKMGIIDINNNIVVPFEYDTILQGKGGVFIAQKEGKWGALLVGNAIDLIERPTEEPTTEPVTAEKTTAEKTTVEKTTVEKTTEEKTTAEETTEEKTTKPRDEEPTTDKPESTTAPEDDEVIGTYKIIRAVNVRDDAGEDNARLGSIKVGETVKAYDSKKAPSGVTWIQIDFDGEKGWISTNFVEKIS